MGFRVVVLVSGSGTLLQALLDAVEAREADAEIVAVVADRQDCGGLERARRAGIPAIGHPLGKGADRDAWDAELAGLIERYSPDLIASAGFMKLLGRHVLGRFGGRIINTHPALLPSFPGMHGPRDALAYGVKVSGATVFWVDEGVDTGRILAQEAVPVFDGDTVEELHERIKVVERRLLVDVVRTLAAQKGR
ncbi:MAG: phosphoribosylglycinamide formyltransferase [Propionibacteriaceae bacterium]|nr:phosphoribosylglycinamide formyltransferase [Propionibacteriaceae bacterium]